MCISTPGEKINKHFVFSGVVLRLSYERAFYSPTVPLVFFSHQKQWDDPGVHDQGARSSFFHFRHTMNEVLN